MPNDAPTIRLRKTTPSCEVRLPYGLGALDRFHVYAVDWQPTRISIFVDNELVLKVDDKGFGAQSWPYDQRFHLLLNLAVGGWGGMKGIDDRAFPACFEVDSVRVFQKRGGR